MAYTIEDIKKSQEIFYYLLEHHELREEEEQILYKAYTEEENVQNIVKSQGETASCDIERYGNIIYLIPRENNNFLGYSKAELKKEYTIELAEEVHHKEPIQTPTGWIRRFEWSNLISLCHKHHDMAHNRFKRRK